MNVVCVGGAAFDLPSAAYNGEYVLPSQVQCSRFKAPSALFQC